MGIWPMPPWPGDPAGGYPRDNLPSAHDTTPAARPGPGQRLRRGGRSGSRRLPHWRPRGGCHLPARSLRDGRLRWPGRRGRHCGAAPQGRAAARHRIAVAAPPSAPDDERRSAGRGGALIGAGSSICADVGSNLNPAGHSFGSGKSVRSRYPAPRRRLPDRSAAVRARRLGECRHTLWRRGGTVQVMYSLAPLSGSGGPGCRRRLCNGHPGPGVKGR